MGSLGRLDLANLQLEQLTFFFFNYIATVMNPMVFEANQGPLRSFPLFWSVCLGVGLTIVSPFLHGLGHFQGRAYGITQPVAQVSYETLLGLVGKKCIPPTGPHAGARR